MKTLYSIDTNVFLSKINIVQSLSDKKLFVPFRVVQELDGLKKEIGETAFKARNALKFIEDNKNVIIGQKLSRDSDDNKFETSDDEILAEIARFSVEEKYKKTVVYSNDLAFKIKAKLLGFEAQKIEEREYNENEFKSIEVSEDDLLHFWNDYEVARPEKYFPNEYVYLTVQGETKALGRYNDYGFVKLRSSSPFNLSPSNAEQAFALDALMNPEINLVSLLGPAGSGKTLIALAASLELSLDQGLYDKILVSRPVFPMGKDIGYLPGTMEEKLSPYVQPIYDNLEVILGGRGKTSAGKAQELVNQSLIQIEPLTYIRGRSLHNQILIVDEAQNLTPLEVKTIITRAGKNTKIILTGDVTQIDHHHLDSINNGLTYATEAFKDEKIAACVHLIKSERSELAEIAARIL